MPSLETNSTRTGPPPADLGASASPKLAPPLQRIRERLQARPAFKFIKPLQQDPIRCGWAGSVLVGQAVSDDCATAAAEIKEVDIFQDLPFEHGGERTEMLINVGGWATASLEKNNRGRISTNLGVKPRSGGPFSLRLSVREWGEPRIVRNGAPDHAACAWRAA
jgi:hypothetical protein